jgi:N-acetylated-alpha-linked acidic dipeptidase
MEKFGDPAFSYHATLARLWGLMAMRLACLPLLPFDYAEYGSQVERFVENIEKKIKEDRLDLDLSDLHRAARGFQEAARRYRDATSQTGPDSGALKSVNEALVDVERAFLDPAGLPMRPWYRHTIFAPGFYTGYEAEVLPGLQQAVAEKEATKARVAALQAVQALERARRALFLPATP